MTQLPLAVPCRSLFIIREYFNDSLNFNSRSALDRLSLNCIFYYTKLPKTKERTQFNSTSIQANLVIFFNPSVFFPNPIQTVSLIWIKLNWLENFQAWSVWAEVRSGFNCVCQQLIFQQYFSKEKQVSPKHSKNNGKNLNINRYISPYTFLLNLSKLVHYEGTCQSENYFSIVRPGNVKCRSGI